MSQINSVSDLTQPAPTAPAAQSSLSQVTSISQLSDVQPTDWAFQALQSLVERYGCIAGYPDGTFRGQRSLSRFEFAAGLNACLDRINELIQAGLADAASREDLAALQRLQEEFNTELATIRGRTDVLEARLNEVEANQFSTTTTLRGETVFGLYSILSGDSATGEELERVPVFGYRVELNLNTSFTGEDLLTARLQSNNNQPLGGTESGELGTNMGRIEFDGTSDNVARISLLRYRVPLGEDSTLYIAAQGNGFVDLDASAQLTPYTDGSAVGLFGLRNPIYNYSSGTGLGFRQFFFDDFVELNLGYLASDANNPNDRGGLFNGRYAALAQVILHPSDDLRIGFSYINSYTPGTRSTGTQSPDLVNPVFGTATGSNLSNDAFGRPVVVNAYGISGTFDIAENFAIGGWVGYAHHTYIGRGDADVWNWAVNLAFPDLFGEGNIGGVIVGMEPRVTEISDNLNNGEPDEDVGLHIEGYYRYRINDNIDITPGVIWITAPDHNADNDDAILGVLRTRFFF
ncbi:MAG: iron uptake porin [Microcoleus sp. SIO2G3]|nr:iron uptake porin [Microcoleus sp. SIO2G3]